MKKSEFIQNELERRLFKTALTVSIFTVSVLLIIDIFYLKDYYSVFIEIGGIVVFSFLYYWSGRRLYSSRLILPYLVVLFLIINGGWYVGGGFVTGLVLLFFLSLSVSLIMIPSRYRRGWVVFFTVDIILLMIFEFLNPEIRLVEDDKSKILITTYLFMGITYSLSIYLIVFAKDNYEEVRKILSLQNERLNLQSDNLRVINKKLTRANDLLERKITERTVSVEEKKEKILNCAFMNSHHVRAPLVNIIGLTNLYESKLLSEGEKYFVLEKLKTSAHQLNREFEMVRDHIEQEEFKKNS
jgi:signal transduction histidine kinase